jgi:predicted DNA-binding transcriptional regulator AlpA
LEIEMNDRANDEVNRDDRLTYEVPEAGALLGLSRNASYCAAKRGDFPIIKIGKRMKVPKAAFHKMLELSGA